MPYGMKSGSKPASRRNKSVMSGKKMAKRYMK